MTFDQAYQKLEESFPNQYVVLSYTRGPNGSSIKGYVEEKGWSSYCNSIDEVILKLKGKEVIPPIYGPEVS